VPEADEGRSSFWIPRITYITYPAFFDEVETITLHDPLAEFLGSASDGRIKYAYVDTVKLAGHSCPTVAGAYRAQGSEGDLWRAASATQADQGGDQE